MADNETPVQDFITSHINLLQYFKCEGNFFIKPLTNYEWCIKGVEDFYILSYWNEKGIKTDAVIVKRGGVPMVYKTRDYTMIVAIDCVKIGFVFSNKNKHEL